MAASQLWYVPHRPDLVLLAPCDEEGSLPCPGSMYVSVDHLHPPDRPENKWAHPRVTRFLTCYGDIGRQQPRVVRCACGSKPCKLRDVKEGSCVPDELIPADWATRFELPPNDPAHAASDGRRAHAVQLWLDCTAKAEKELPCEEGKDHPAEEGVLKAAEMMLTDYLKGRICHSCNVPSTKMQKCGRCQQARYCSKECQRAHWSSHKPECRPVAAVATAPSTTTMTTEGPVAPAAAENKGELTEEADGMKERNEASDVATPDASDVAPS